MSEALQFFSRGDAIIDGPWRYSLRRWGWSERHAPRIAWIMLNPSTADAQQDDPTMRRVIRFSRDWGYGSLEVVNLFALRSLSPAALAGTDGDPVGPENDGYIARAVRGASCVVAAWGRRGGFRGRDLEVLRILERERKAPVCLERTTHGHPRHPLYVPSATPLRTLETP